MKKLLTTLLLGLLCAVTIAQSRIETHTITSKILGVDKTCSVYLPNGYDNSKESYPILYLLHGAGDNHTGWITKGNMKLITDEAIASGEAVPMVVIMPDASADQPNKHMGYFDSSVWKYESYFFGELLPTIERHYRIVGDKKNRAIAGLSMGGGGSVVYAMHHPELFSAACPLSAVLDKFPRKDNPNDPFIVSATKNSPVEALRTWTDEQIAALRTVRWRVDCGDDDFLYLDNIRFYELMRKRQIPIEYRMRDGGHTWWYWQGSLPNILSFISMGFTR